MRPIRWMRRCGSSISWRSSNPSGVGSRFPSLFSYRDDQRGLHRALALELWAAKAPSSVAENPGDPLNTVMTEPHWLRLYSLAVQLPYSAAEIQAQAAIMPSSGGMLQAGFCRTLEFGSASLGLPQGNVKT